MAASFSFAAGRHHVTAGLYLAASAERSQPPAAVSARLRDYLGWLVASSAPVYGVVLPRVFDIDRARDIEAAESAGLDRRPGFSRMKRPRPCCGHLPRAHPLARAASRTTPQSCRRVAEAMAERGFSVELVAADAALTRNLPRQHVRDVRARSSSRSLKAMEKAGSIVVNSADAIRNTYRHRMVELFARHNVSAPMS